MTVPVRRDRGRDTDDVDARVVDQSKRITVRLVDPERGSGLPGALLGPGGDGREMQPPQTLDGRYVADPSPADPSDPVDPAALAQLGMDLGLDA